MIINHCEQSKMIISVARMDLQINSAQRLIRAQFPNLNRLVLSLLQNQPLIGTTNSAIQIFHALSKLLIRTI